MTDRSVDWDRAAADYHRTRGASAAWRDPVRDAFAPAPAGPVVDLGSGTGLWSGLLGEWTGRAVLAVEPSPGLAHWRESLPRQRVSDTTLVGLSDDEFAAGLRAVDADIAAGVEPPPLGLDLLVLR